MFEIKDIYSDYIYCSLVGYDTDDLNKNLVPERIFENVNFEKVRR